MRNYIAFAFVMCLALAGAPKAWAGVGGSNAALENAIQSSSPESIVAEVERAEKLACVSCIQTVESLIDHPDARVRQVAAWWLAKRGVRDQIRDQAYARLKGTDPQFARNAAELLGTFRHPEAVPALASYLAHPLDAESGAAAATALGTIGHSSAIPALKTALTSSLPAVRAAAAAALREIRGGTDTSGLLAALTDADESVRTQAVYTLGALGDASAVSALATVATGDKSAAVRKHAAWALGQIGDHAALAALTQAESDADPQVRSIARAALSRLH